jgi:hypothetical protein
MATESTTSTIWALFTTSLCTRRAIGGQTSANRDQSEITSNPTANAQPIRLPVARA